MLLHSFIVTHIYYYNYYYYDRKRDCVVGIATRLQAGRFGVRIPAKEKRFSPSKTFRPALGTTQPSLPRTSRFPLGGKMAGA